MENQRNTNIVKLHPLVLQKKSKVIYRLIEFLFFWQRTHCGLMGQVPEIIKDSISLLLNKNMEFLSFTNDYDVTIDE